MKDVIGQEMAKERDKLEKIIVVMEHSLGKARVTQSDQPRNDSWTNAYSRWDCYEDADELESRVDIAKKNLAKLTDKIKNHGGNDSDKECNHRFNCSCSGDKSAEREVVAMKTSERLEQMARFKNDGNVLFANQPANFKEALALYERSLIYFEYCFDGTDAEIIQADTLRLQCLLNASACFLHLKMYPKCIEYCDEALEVDSRSAKAWFRRGRAHRLQQEFVASERDLRKAKEVSVDGDTQDIQRERRLLNEAKEHYKQSSTEVAKAIRT